MAAIQLTRKQIIDAVRQLSDEDRLNVLRELVGTTDRDRVTKSVDRVRPAFRLTPPQQRRLATLLQMGNTGTLKPEERQELDELCQLANERTLEMAREVVRTVASNGDRG